MGKNMFNRLLLFFVPDKQAKILAGVLSAVSFLLGLIDMVSRDFGSARFYLNLSVGIILFLLVLKFFAMRATYMVAEEAQRHLQQHIRRKRAPQPHPTLTPAQQRAQEKQEMAELADTLRQALKNIEPDSPIRPKYEATLELMQRIASHSH